MKAFIGIDNGLDGGIVVLDGDGGIYKKTPMPVVKLGKGRIVDVDGIQSYLELASLMIPYALLENASKHSPGVLALCSTWYSLGSIETILKLSKTKYDLINPQKWQKEFWTKPKMAKGQKFDTKAAALNAARKLWPGNEWLATPRCSTPHDGMIDAALIAEYARRKLG